MKKIHHFFQNYKNFIYGFLVLICSCLGITFAYLYGASNSRVSQYASIVSTDLRAKKESLDFLHGRVNFSTSLKNPEKYKTNLSLQLKTIYQYRYFNSYLLSVKSNNEVMDYKTKISFVDSEKEIELETSHLAMVRKYWDEYYMESIGLPLFYINENTSKNNIGSKNKDVNFGCYISSSQAYEMAIGLGLLKDGETDSKLISAAFSKLISSPNEFYLYLTSSPIESTFTVNNIYIDSPKFMSLLTSEQRYISEHRFNDYYLHFAKYNKNTIFTYAENVFSTFNSALYFDIVETTSNISLYFDNILGKDYIDEGLKVEFKTGFEEIDSLSDGINEAFSKRSNGNIVYILLSFLFFELLIFSHTAFLSVRDKKRYAWIAKLFLPSMPFVCLWVVVSFLFIFTKNKASIFFAFNYIGNMIVVLFLLIITIFGYILRLLGDDDEKLYI